MRIRQRSIPLLDDGSGSDVAAGDGVYTGEYVVPTECTGAIDFQVSVTRSLSRAIVTLCRSTAPRLFLDSQLRSKHWAGRGSPGETRSYSISISNDGGPVQLKVALQSDQFAPFVLTSAVNEVGNGGGTLEFTLTANDDAEFGTAP